MLGPVDLYDWQEDDSLLRAALRMEPKIRQLKLDAGALFSGWSASHLELGRRFARGDLLDTDEVRVLAEILDLAEPDRFSSPRLGLFLPRSASIGFLSAHAPAA